MRIFNVLISFVVAALLVGCCQGCNKGISVNPGADNAVLDAIADINSHYGSELIHIDYSGGWFVWQISYDADPMCGEYLGCSNGYTNTISLPDSNLDYIWRYRVALHELGHSLGLQHSKELTDIMCPGVDERQIHFTDEVWQRFINSLNGKPNSEGDTPCTP